jgi:DNA polymerase I-like protein with 3'-5' exonuclease and polymerase domains
MARRTRFAVPDAAVVDFETEAIEPTPDYPPEPVGVSIMLPGDRGARYHSWGHPTGNNCTRRDGERALAAVWRSKLPIVFHHSKFDMAVAEERCGLPRLPWERVHDTMFLLFLDDPYSKDLKLKEAAVRLLGMKPEERDAIREWAIAERLIPKNAKEVGHLICKAPGTLVGPYANGDVIRTKKLFVRLLPSIHERGMMPAYERERRLTPCLMDNEREGVRADLPALRAAAKTFGASSDAEKFGDASWFSGGAMDQTDAWLRKALRTKDLNVDSDDELADALVAAGKADEGGFLATPTGKRSTSKDSIIQAVTDRRVLQVLQYRARLATAKNTFILPWLREAHASKGVVRPSWNQVRQWGHGKDAGAKTGRLSASRFMNVPKPFLEREGKFEHPHFAGLPALPEVRQFLLPDRGGVWGKRDYAQQELRVLAHFEDGVLLENYLKDPRLDVHRFAARLAAEHGALNEADPERARDIMKTIGFALLYGMGLGELARRLGIDVSSAKRLKKAYLSIFPGLEDLDDDLKEMGRQGVPVVTWGGREYLVEPPKYSEKFGRMQTFEYKLINFLIQGSSADCTKEALIRYHSMKREARFLITVHDEINVSLPKGREEQELRILGEAMMSVEFDAPMLSDASVGPRWNELKKVKESWYDDRLARLAA